MRIGTLEALRRYPIKSLRGEALERVTVETSGIPGDRGDALFARDGARAGKTYRGKENDRLHLVADAAAAEVTAGERSDIVELRHGEHFFDDAPISILVDVWMRELDRHVGYSVEWERFRPNLFVRAGEAGAPAEEALIGAELTLGSVRLRVRSPIERCVTITYHPKGEASDPRILRFLAQERRAWLGIYCDVLEPGRARLGDALARLDPK